MSDILFQYERVNPTSWAYLSSLLLLALFFKFNRVFSVRNVDLFMLIALAPGLLLVLYSYEKEGLGDAVNVVEIQELGFLWLFAVGAIILGRLLLDAAMHRRPLLDPNLNAAGLAFLGSSLLFFLMANVVTGRPKPTDVSPALTAAELKAESARLDPEGDDTIDTFETEGPGYWLLYLLPRISTQTVIDQSSEAPPETDAERLLQQQKVGAVTARVVAIISQVMIVVGLVLVGSWHFDNLVAGIAAAVMYLLLPYTAKWCGDPEHCLPASLLVWAVVLYRRPMMAGILIGLASGTIYYPIFLLPLWCSFYWERGVKRFAVGFLIAIAALVITMAITAGSPDRFLAHLRQMFGIRWPRLEHLQGIWRFWDPVYRIPIIIGFSALAISFVAWPSRKNLGVLISCTAALMVGAQFWQPHEGGMYVAWYLPLLLLTIYRPNLDDRVAETMVSESWWEQRKRRAAAG
jgi:hypothetical protein